jgi:hypothetical protein
MSSASKNPEAPSETPMDKPPTEVLTEAPLGTNEAKVEAKDVPATEKPTMDTTSESAAKEKVPEDESEKKGESDKEEDNVKETEGEDEPQLLQEPKRARSAYQHFIVEQTPVAKKENPGLSGTGTKRSLF